MKRIVSYLRISTANQIDNTSIEVQREKIDLYCKLNNITLVQEFKDEGLSAKGIESREQYKQMMDFIKDIDNNVDGILVYKADRIHTLSICRNGGVNVAVLVNSRIANTHLEKLLAKLISQNSLSLGRGAVFIIFVRSRRERYVLQKSFVNCHFNFLFQKRKRSPRPTFQLSRTPFFVLSIVFAFQH